MTPSKEVSAIAINEVQLILAEKRTALAVLRTGIAVLALPMSVMSFLIATSKHYTILHVLHILIPLGVINFCLVIFGAWLIVHSIRKMRRYDEMIAKIKSRYEGLSQVVD